MKRLGRTAASGLAIASAAGLAGGVVEVVRNRYIEHGLVFLAFESAWSTSLSVALRFLPVFTGACFLYFIVDALSGSAERTNARFSALIAAAAAATLWVFTGWHLNRAAWFPPFWSATGVLLNVLVTVAVAGVGVIAWRGLLRVRPPTFASLGNGTIGVLLAVLLLLGAARWAFAPGGGTGGTSVLLITVDTLRADHLGCYGYARNTSPVMDELAGQGVLFGEAVVQWPKTSPSFASMMTSTYSHRNGVQGTRQRLGDANTTLAEVLRNAGYRTAGVVGNANLSTDFNFDQGFDWYQEPWNDEGVRDDVKDGCGAGRLTDRAIGWLEANGEGGRFFLWIHYIDPHAKYVPPPPYDSLFVGDALYAPDGGDVLVLHDGLNEDMGGVPGRSRLGDHDRRDYYIAMYDGEIRYMDAEIGRLIDRTRQLGLWEDLLVVLTSDHGESLGEHDYYFEHGRLPYDACARVPLIVSGGAVPRRGVRVVHPVAVMDVFPTILDIIGVEPTGEESGISLRPLIEGADAPGREYVFMESGYERNYQRSIRNGRWKLIYVPDERARSIMTGSEFELYDIVADPGETRNLVDVETAVAETLRTALFRWMDETGSAGESRADRKTVGVDEETEAHLRALGYVN
jgi:arylsulfatase